MGVVFWNCCINNTDIALLYTLNVMSGRYFIGIVVGTVILQPKGSLLLENTVA